MDMLKKNISNNITVSKKFPEEVEIGNSLVKISYTIDEEFQGKIFNLVNTFRPDYAAVVVIDNSTGNIISAIGYQGQDKQFDQSLIFKTENPAASIFKIITAASLLEKDNLDIDSEVRVKGKGTTLYKYQLKDYENQRWTRAISLNKAFALSNNVAFGKMALKNLSASNIDEAAEKFYFNKELMTDIEVPNSNYRSPSSQYNLAEIASGFNRSTTLTPIHAAFLASVVANKGIAHFPRLINFMAIDEKPWVIEGHSPIRIIEESVASSLESMMIETIDTGTARKSFRQFGRKNRDKIIVGGKTGTITGGDPVGKRDWFVAFAKNKNLDNQGISLSVMLVNQKKWKVKSTYLASRIIDLYYNGKKSEKMISLSR